VAHSWVDTCTFKKIFKKINKNKKNLKNHEVTRDSHCSWSLMI